MLKIAHHTLISPILQAPMAGATDRVYRDLVRKHGAGLATSEMITSDLNLINTRKSQLRMPQLDEASPRSIQLVGTEPNIMADAAKFYIGQGAELIDINFGCPVKKVAGSKKLAGSALLKDERKLELIIKAVVEASTVPVTIKYRTGWNMTSRNAIRIGQIAEQAGIKAIVLHGRTREDKYRPFAEYETIRRVKKCISIPLIANGDICDEKTAAFVLDYTQADGIMIGRGSFGQPWIFAELNKQLFGIQHASEITDDYKRNIAVSHVEAVQKLYSKPTHYLDVTTYNRPSFVNKVINWYLITMSIQANVKHSILSCKTPSEQLLLFKDALYAEANTKNLSPCIT
ncbi:MAG: tRNA dihydrouridine synthase DusB [Leucothrix sp.]